MGVRVGRFLPEVVQAVCPNPVDVHRSHGCRRDWGCGGDGSACGLSQWDYGEECVDNLGKLTKVRVVRKRRYMEPLS